MAKSKQSKGNSPESNIGTDFLHNLYSEVSLETKDPQPYYIVHKDTFKTFLYEHKESLNYGDKALVFLGIEVSIIVSLLTCSFNDVVGKESKIIVEGNTIQGFFLCSALVIGIFLLYYGIKWLFNIKKSSINYMCSELEKKSSLLVGKNNIQEETSQDIVNTQAVISTQQQNQQGVFIANNKAENINPNDNIESH